MKIVVKVGTSTLAYATGHLNLRHMERLCRVLSDVKNMGHEVILVSSGAVATGIGMLNLRERPTEIAAKQATAAVGQCELMNTYGRAFGQYNHTVAQILLTTSDFSHDDRHANFSNTMARLLEMGVLPIINENDTVATEEFSIGDNDTLSALVAASVKADLLLLFSDIDGLFDKDPRKNADAKLIAEVTEINDQIEAIAEGAGSMLGTGGMKTKLNAAKIATESGCEMVIANGEAPEILYDLLENRTCACTKFLARR